MLWGVFLIIKKILTRIGKRLKSNTERYTAISEALGAIKEVKIVLEKVYTKRRENLQKVRYYTVYRCFSKSSKIFN